jgi:hypothetical protein
VRTIPQDAPGLEVSGIGPSNGSLLSSLPPWPFSAGSNLDFPFSDLDEDPPWDIFQRTGTNALDADTLPFQQCEGERGHASFPLQESGHDTFQIDVDAILLSPFPSPSTELATFALSNDLEAGIGCSEELRQLFQEQTRQVHCIYHHAEDNPWTKHIWPLVKKSRALYHAVTAMTCLQHSKVDETARQLGQTHMRRSNEVLERDLDSGNMDLEIALAVTIVLGFAEAWDYGASTSGRSHFNDARRLVQSSVSNGVLQQPSIISTRMTFLANTWIYMNIIARLTANRSPPLDLEMASLFDLHDPYPTDDDMDPLMGYASTLFPVIGRVGDLVSEIRTRVSKRNSPAIISRAIELRKLTEAWAPTVDLEQVDDPTPNMSDVIQTAEAYRFSTLLFLQQAVPELPNLGSVGELGQRTLVYLATIPMTSQTAIAHSYPLMIAGTEALDEDRDFVRERWRNMSTRMIPGIVDRCLEITEEVWRRRDAYLLNLDIPADTSHTRRLSSPISRPGSTDHLHAIRPLDPDVASRALPTTSSTPKAQRSSSMSTHFPISAAFKKGVDPVTRSGNVEYTVKGRLHWLGVMRDWGWESEYFRAIDVDRIADETCSHARVGRLGGVLAKLKVGVGRRVGRSGIFVAACNIASSK